MSALEGSNPIASGVTESNGSCRSFSLAEIQSVTKNFDGSLVIGIGGFGKVYKGVIDDGATIVAVKRLNSESKQGAKEFSAEIKMLSRLQHTNLVALIGYCSDCEEKILVYEYISRGTLADHLYKRRQRESRTSSSPLSWEQRLEICLGVARGLNYIHTGTNQSFIHRDVKTTNILLDQNWIVKISDFGLSKGTASHSVTHLTTHVKGTFGYLDPDYFYTRKLTTKSDVYAFGVVLLEVLSGRLPVDTTVEEEKISLVRWAERCIKKGKLDKIIDPSLSGQILLRCLKYFIQVANNCLQKDPKARPTMAEVVGTLQLALASQRKVQTEGMITKVLQGIALVPKGMDRWLRERKDDEDGSTSRPTKDLPPESRPESVTQFFRHFSPADIQAATNDFDKARLIHQNGNVYKGLINMDGRPHVVAIYRFKEMKLPEWDNIRAAIQEYSQLRHPNIVPLFGFCYEGHELILVSDYMANGSSLKDRLNCRESKPLSWEEQLEICIGVGRGLQYLHAGAEHRTNVQYNIKLSNIWLDKNEVPKVTWLAITTRRSEKTTRKYVVYSFGVVLWKVLTVKQALKDFLMANPGYRKSPLFDLIVFILRTNAIHSVIQPDLRSSISDLSRSLAGFFEITLNCLSEQPSIDSAIKTLGKLQSARTFRELHRFETEYYYELLREHVPNYGTVEGIYGDVDYWM